jgi:hypothetical protein
MSSDGLVDIVTCYWLDDQGSITCWVGNFFRRRDQTYPAGHAVFFPESTGVNRPEREADHSPPLSAKDENTLSYIPTHHTFSPRAS